MLINYLKPSGIGDLDCKRQYNYFGCVTKEPPKELLSEICHFIPYDHLLCLFQVKLLTQPKGKHH